jgi:hypothetical protein
MARTDDQGCPTDEPPREWTSHTSRWATPLAARLRCGCVFEEQPRGAFGLLVTRADPRMRRGTPHGRRQVRAPIQAHWPLLAPSVFLLTGHPIACLCRRCRGAASAGHMVAPHAEQAHGWLSFATAYQAELEEQPFLARLAVARHIVAWLREYETVTILSCEQRVPHSSRPDCWAQRHIFRDWVRALMPLAQPLGADAYA